MHGLRKQLVNEYSKIKKCENSIRHWLSLVVQIGGDPVVVCWHCALVFCFVNV